MGYFAEQGNPFDHRDGVENFEPKPTCIPELKIKESFDGIVTPGETINVQITATNHTLDSVTMVKITEELPSGLQLVDGSTNIPVSVEGDNLIFELGTLKQNEEKNLEFTLRADPGIYSQSKFYDDMETDEGDWFGLVKDKN